MYKKLIAGYGRKDILKKRKKAHTASFHQYHAKYGDLPKGKYNQVINAKVREANYEIALRILMDCDQGHPTAEEIEMGSKIIEVIGLESLPKKHDGSFFAAWLKTEVSLLLGNEQEHYSKSN